MLDQSQAHASGRNHSHSVSATQAGIWYQQGKPRAARQLCEQWLYATPQNEMFLSPSVALRIHRIAADACAALADFESALRYERAASFLKLQREQAHVERGRGEDLQMRRHRLADLAGRAEIARQHDVEIMQPRVSPPLPHRAALASVPVPKFIYRSSMIVQSITISGISTSSRLHLFSTS